MTIPNTTKQHSSQQYDEHILVVKRDVLFPHGAWHGIKQVDFDEYLTIIQTHKEFQPRSLMEADSTYKQIIPYMIFEHNGRYFLMQRQSKASETRLQNKFTLGIGGHIRQEDIIGSTIFDWARREFHEEVVYNGKLTVKPLGLLNDDSNAVGQVHIGFVLLLHGDSDTIKVKSELKNASLISLKECAAYFNNMETWSQIVYTFLLP